MIASFRDAVLEAFYCEGASKRTRRIPADLYRVLRRKLDLIFNATGLNDLRVPPANRLEALKRKRRGYHSIRVNEQWRLVFRWVGDAAHEVELTDYH